LQNKNQLPILFFHLIWGWKEMMASRVIGKKDSLTETLMRIASTTILAQWPLTEFLFFHPIAYFSFPIQMASFLLSPSSIGRKGATGGREKRRN
jgi:hypothetical protein